VLNCGERWRKQASISSGMVQIWVIFRHERSEIILGTTQTEERHIKEESKR